jgi:hypothetical protein
MYPGLKKVLSEIRNAEFFKFVEGIASRYSSDVHDQTLDLIVQRDQLLMLPVGWIHRNAH